MPPKETSHRSRRKRQRLYEGSQVSGSYESLSDRLGTQPKERVPVVRVTTVVLAQGAAVAVVVAGIRIMYM